MQHNLIPWENRRRAGAGGWRHRIRGLCFIRQMFLFCFFKNVFNDRVAGGGAETKVFTYFKMCF